MDRPWTAIVGGACGLLVLGLTVKHFRSSDSSNEFAEGTHAQVEQLARRAGGDRPGWIAHSDAEGPAHPGDEASASVTQGASARGSHGQGGTQGDVGGSRPEAGGATVLSGGEGRRSYVGSGSGAQSGDPGAVRAGGSLQASGGAPFQGALSGSAGQQDDREQRMLRNLLNQPAAPGAAKDPQASEDGLLLQMSFDKSTQPEKGDAAPLVEQGVTLDESGARFATNAQFAIPNAGNINGEAGTISFNVSPDWAGSDANLASLLQLRGDTWENRLQIFKDGPYMRFLFTPDSGTESGAGTNIANWQPGEQHQITTTWGMTDSGEQMASLYIDGHLAGQQTYQGQLHIQPNTPLFIGSDYAGQGPGAGGSIGSLKIYDHIVPP